MPRPVGSKNKAPSRNKKEKKIISEKAKKATAKIMDENTLMACARCATLKAKKHFYESYDNPMQPTGRVPYCKDCLKIMISDDKGNVSLEKVKDALQKIDKPFIYDLWCTSIDSKGDTWGMFIKNLQLPQYRKFTWKDSIFQAQITKLNYDSVEDDKNIKHISTNNDSKVMTAKNTEFEINDDIIDKWGFGYSDEEYFYFEKKWKKLIDNYGEKTSLHVEGLITYIRFRVKEELATAAGDVKEAKEWAAMAKQAAQDAKLNVSQLSKSDISGGIELLPQLFEAVESKVGIISIMPKLKEQPYDDADLIIWCVVNYIRRLEDKPRINYKDVWNFYDKMLMEHYTAQGYSKVQIKQEKEKRNNIFRDLGEVYREPVYEEGDDS